MTKSPDTVCAEVYNIAKFNFNWSIGCKVAVYLVGITGVFFAECIPMFSPVIAPILVFLLVIGSEVFLLISDNYKSTAEALRRKLDLSDSFGWQVSKKEVAEVLTGVPERLQKKWQLRDDTYFSDKKEFCAQKAMANLEESSWWSKHLSNTMFVIYLVVIIVVSLLSILALFVSLNANIDSTYIPKVSKIVISSIMVLFSIGSIKIMIAYSKFHRKSEIIEALTKVKQKQADLSDIEAVRLWAEYHVSRASAPLIPSAIWKHRRNRLNQLWEAGAD